MRHLKEPLPLKQRLKLTCESLFPNRKDNFKQIVIKCISLVCVITLIVSSVYIVSYFLESSNQENILEQSREIWNNTSDTSPVTSSDTQVSTPENPQSESKKVYTKQEAMELLLKQNKDFKGWLTIKNARVDNPVYQADNNDYYLNHNQKRQRSSYGALYFDCNNVITESKTDKNLVIYGHEMRNGTMFGSLKRFRQLSFYKNNPTVTLTTLYSENTYQVFAVFVLNADKADDNNYIYNIYKKDFSGDEEFSVWVNEAFERSIINTGVDVTRDDEILTLLTCCEDFDNARLVVMTRKIREGETIDTSKATANQNPRYPKRWYDDRGYTYPYS